MEVGESNAIGCKTVDVGSEDRLVAVTSHSPVSQVIRQDQHDVRLPGRQAGQPEEAACGCPYRQAPRQLISIHPVDSRAVDGLKYNPDIAEARHWSA
jgi:hypothetical protein